jgi:hypothetical protein
LNRTRQTSRFVSLLVAIAALIPRAGADSNDETLPGALKASELRSQGFRPLLGENLDQWDTNETKRRHWTFHGTELHYDGDNEKLNWKDSNLWTKESFGDTQLYVEWRLPRTPAPKPQPIVLWNGDFLLDNAGKRITRMGPDAGDSGILFRGTLKCQANIWCQELGSGEVNGFRTDKKLPIRVRQSCLPFAVADRPMGEWNVFLITLKDERLSVKLNGQDVLATEPLPDLPAQGPIGLQHHGDPIQFRNIWIKEISKNE